MTENKSSIKKNFSYNLIYQILIFIVPLITSPYLSRVLGPVGIGKYSYTYSIASYFVLFSMLGIKNYGNRTIALSINSRKELSKSFWSLYWFQFILSLIVFSLYIIYVLLSNNEYSMLLWIQSLFVFSAISDISWFFFGLEQFKLTVTRNILIKLLSVFLIFLFVKNNTDTWKYTLIMSSTTLLSQLYMWSYVNKNVDFYKPSYKEIVVHLKPNIALFIPVLAVSIYKIFSKVILGNYSDMHQVGFFENAEKLINIPLGVITAFGTVMLPRMTSVIAEGNKNQAKKYIEESFTYVMMISCGFSFGIASVSEAASAIFFGPDFKGIEFLIKVLSPSLIFIAWANIIRTQYLIPNRKDSAYILSVFLGAIVNVLSNLILIPKYNAFGAVFSTVFAEFTVALVQTFYVRHDLPIKKALSSLLHFMLIGLIMYFIVTIIGNLKLSKLVLIIIQVITGGLVYFIISLLYLLRTQNITIIRLLNNIKKKLHKIF